jgi:hypothetical protein
MTADPAPGRPSSRRPGELQRPPAGISRRVWAAVLSQNDFAPHERITYDLAGRWWAIHDQQLLEAEALTGRERDAKIKAAGDSATVALRHWRALKFVDPSKPARGPGRPSGLAWSAAGRAAMAAREKAEGRGA